MLKLCVMKRIGFEARQMCAGLFRMDVVIPEIRDLLLNNYRIIESGIIHPAYTNCQDLCYQSCRVKSHSRVKICRANLR